MIERAVYVRLRTDADVAALVVGRIFHSMARQSTALPYIVLRRISTVYGRTFTGNDLLHTARVQVDCYASDSGTCQDLNQAVRAALEHGGNGWTVGSYLVVSASPEDTTDLTEPPFDGSDRPSFRFSTDYAVQFFELPTA